MVVLGQSGLAVGIGIRMLAGIRSIYSTLAVWNRLIAVMLGSVMLQLQAPVVFRAHTGRTRLTEPLVMHSAAVEAMETARVVGPEARTF